MTRVLADGFGICGGMKVQHCVDSDHLEVSTLRSLYRLTLAKGPCLGGLDVEMLYGVLNLHFEKLETFHPYKGLTGV